MEPILILGGGLAGLSAAFYSPRKWRLIEKTERVGGLVKTEVIGNGFYFDPTGHWLHLRVPEITRLVTTEWIPDGLVSIQRKAAVFSRGVFTRFPYQVNTHGLPAEVISENLIGFVEAHYGESGRELRQREPRNFEEFILRYMGAGFARNFMIPYNRKLWRARSESVETTLDTMRAFFIPKKGESKSWPRRFSRMRAAAR